MSLSNNSGLVSIDLIILQRERGRVVDIVPAEMSDLICDTAWASRATNM